MKTKGQKDAESEAREGEPARKIALAMTLALFTGGLAITIWLDEKYERWLEENHPFAGIKNGAERARINMRNKQTATGEVFGTLGDLVDLLGSAMKPIPG